VSMTFRKMHGAANDFVVIDHRAPFLPADRRALFARWCDRRRGIGADGVLLLEQDTHLDFAMVYHNADGGPADFCGNGARCLARFALDLGLGHEGMVRFRTAAGEKSARRLADGRIALAFGGVGEPEPVRIDAEGRTFEGVSIAAARALRRGGDQRGLRRAARRRRGGHADVRTRRGR
jgi:diaminopimelate epimerase